MTSSTATFTVEEVRPTSAQYQISTISDDQIALLVREKAITPAIEASLREVVKRKAEIARVAEQISTRESEVSQISRDQDRVRENMKSLKGSGEERQLLQRYVRQLDEQENRLDVLRKELAALTAQRQKAQDELSRFIENLGGDSV